MMRVGFGITALVCSQVQGGVDGIGNYTRELMARLDENPDVSLFQVLYGGTKKDFSDIDCPFIRFSKYTKLVALSVATGISFHGSGKLKKSIDLVHATDHYIPRHRNIPVVATLHDAIPLSHPEWVNAGFRKLKNTLWKRAAHWAAHIITISEYSKQEIAHYFAIDAQKISVIPNGVDERWFRPVDEQARNKVLKQYNLPRHYFLVVGTLQPRKNIARIIEAYRSLPAGIRHEVPLIVVGRAGWRCENVVEMLTSPAAGDSLRWLKHLPDDDLFAVLKGATALVFPSLCEGFGLPVVEAFAAGTPVITSNTTALPEVAGDAALLVNPLDVADIAAAMQSMLEQPELANVLRRKGKERALAYSWDVTAAMTLDVYQKTLEAA